MLSTADPRGEVVLDAVLSFSMSSPEQFLPSPPLGPRFPKTFLKLGIKLPVQDCRNFEERGFELGLG